jgi:hypothetical protein
MTQRERVYRDALANIKKLCGECWDGSRICYDPQHVASLALQKADPKFFSEIDDVPYREFYVKRDGGFHRREKRK